MQLELPLADHVMLAKEFARRVHKTRGTMFICCGYGGRYYLSVRTFDGPEVEWNDLRILNSKQEALDIKRAGVCTDWLDCLKE